MLLAEDKFRFTFEDSHFGCSVENGLWAEKQEDLLGSIVVVHQYSSSRDGNRCFSISKYLLILHNLGPFYLLVLFTRVTKLFKEIMLHSEIMLLNIMKPLKINLGKTF